ncbi:MAG TPA: hypothetical protein GX718_02090 [Brevibacterium sp.]|nr:hypothetical protein [Brevibacterium sp.]
MSLYNRWAAPEPDYTDDEWERARARIVADRLDDGWDRDDAEAAAEDDQLVWEQIDADRVDAESRWADDMLARRKEGL